MSNARDEYELDDVDFSWGSKIERGGTSRDVQFYKSFTFDSVEYFLYDSVYLFQDDQPEPYIGKLIQLYELPNKARKVKLLWFFRPSEISDYLGGVKVLENELFLATGFGKGLINVNPLEAIGGKCNTVCISKDERNRQPSLEELNAAEYVYYRTFDVQYHTTSEILDEKIATIEVKNLLNKIDFLPSGYARVESENVVVRKENPQKKSFDDSDSLEERPSENPILDGIAPLTRNDGGISTCKIVNEFVSSYEATQTTAIAVGTHDQSEMGKLVDPLEKETNHGKKSLYDSGNVNVLGLSPSTILSDKQKTELGGIHVGTGVVRKKSTSVAFADAVEDQRSNKKVKLDGVAPPSRDNVGIQTKAFVSNSAKTRQPSPSAAKRSDVVKMGKQLAGTRDGIANIPKPNSIIEDKSEDKLRKLSSKQSEDLEKYDITCSTSKTAPQSVGVAVKISNKSQLGSHGRSKRVKLIDSLNKRSSDKKNVTIPVKDKQKPGLVSNKSNKAPQHAKVDINNGVTLNKGLERTKDGFSKLNSDNLVKDELIVKLHETPIIRSKDLKTRAYGRLKEVTQRPADGSRWMKASNVPWDEQLKEAHDQGTLVLLQNLDPSYTSREIENIVWHGFEYGCTAKMVPRTAISSSHSGQAFAIFKTSEAANKVVRKLNEECLMLPNGRPLVGSIGFVSFPGKQQSSFPGHLDIEKLKRQISRELREAVSTFHFSQPNNLEHELALDWCVLQRRSSGCWKQLHKEQSREIEKLRATLKSK